MTEMVVEMKFTGADVTRLGTAREDIEGMKQFVLERASLHAKMTGSPVSYERGRNGYVFRVDEDDLFNPAVADIRIHVTDAHNGHDAGDRSVPRQFVFFPTEREVKFEQFLALKAEFEPVPASKGAVPKPGPRRSYQNPVVTEDTTAKESSLTDTLQGMKRQRDSRRLKLGQTGPSFTESLLEDRLAQVRQTGLNMSS